MHSATSPRKVVSEGLSCLIVGRCSAFLSAMAVVSTRDFAGLVSMSLSVLWLCQKLAGSLHEVATLPIAL